jgi:hypothetical protein
MPIYLPFSLCYNEAMKAFEFSTTVQAHGDVRIVGVPFPPGTEVKVTISPKRKSAAEFAETWQRVSAELRHLREADSISDADIQKEIDDFRAGR